MIFAITKLKIMKPSQFPFLFSLLFPILFWTSCGDDDIPCIDPYNPECDNYDPCLEALETSAEFGFYRKFPHQSEERVWFEETDTFYLPPSSFPIYFKADSSNMTSYEWTIGLDPRTFTDSVFNLEFENIGGNLDVTLKATNDQVLPECFPDDTGYAEKTKSIYLKLVPPEEWPMKGTFRGYNEDNPNNIWDIQINDNNGLVNFPENCPWAAMPIPGGPKHKWFSTDPNDPKYCNSPQGGLILQEDFKTLIIDYTIEVPEYSGIRETHRWIGTKIE